MTRALLACKRAGRSPFRLSAMTFVNGTLLRRLATPTPWVSIVAALLLGGGAASAAAQSFDRNAWLDDYAYLKRALEVRYANLAWFASPEGGVDLPAVDRRTLAMLRSATNDDDAKITIQSFVRAFHDGHFSQLAPSRPALAA